MAPAKMTLPVASDATLLAQREEGVYMFVQVVCYHETGALEKREELIRLVKSKDCSVTYVDQVYGSFYFIIPPGVKNPLAKHKDKETVCHIRPFNSAIGTAPRPADTQ